MDLYCLVRGNSLFGEPECGMLEALLNILQSIRTVSLVHSRKVGPSAAQAANRRMAVAWGSARIKASDDQLPRITVGGRSSQQPRSQSE